MQSIFVPGRLCLFGEHSDWAGKYRSMNASIVPGAAIVASTEQGIEVEFEKSKKFEVYNQSVELAAIWQDFSCQMDLEELKSIANSGSFFSYCAGVASYILEWYKVDGVKLTIKKMTLPLKKGLSSSAAICVIVARAFNILYKLNLSTKGEMNIAYWGELRTSSRCGRLDQACAYGPGLVMMTFDSEEIEVTKFNIKKPLYWVFSDLNGKKDTIKILRDLNKAFPFASNKDEERVHQALGRINQDVVQRAVKCMQEGLLEDLGNLMKEAQQIFDTYIVPMCPDELSAPKLHSLLADRYIESLTYGGKGVGSQGDGSIQFLAKDSECQASLIEYLTNQGLNAYPLSIKPKNIVRKAIIPVAGFGTRLYPETRFIKKDFFPIVDKDGLVKPVILILLEELVSSGIEEICLVLGDEEEKVQYSNFFENEIKTEHMGKLSPEIQCYERHILEIGKRLKYVYQTEKKGFGHAVYQCKEFCHNEPVLLLLGDTIYRSYSNKPCALQMMEAFEDNSKPLISVHEVSLEEVSYYGIISGQWMDENKRILRISNITEKPSKLYAEEFLGVREETSRKYYSVFGQYILTSEVFAQLGNNIKNNIVNEKNEIELTTALEQVREKIGMLGIKIDGKMFDMGMPKTFLSTISSYGV